LSKSVVIKILEFFTGNNDKSEHLTQITGFLSYLLPKDKFFSIIFLRSTDAKYLQVMI
jgi:hypothetical protein